MTENSADFGILPHRWHQGVDMAKVASVATKAYEVFASSSRIFKCAKLGLSSL